MARKMVRIIIPTMVFGESVWLEGVAINLPPTIFQHLNGDLKNKLERDY